MFDETNHVPFILNTKQDIDNSTNTTKYTISLIPTELGLSHRIRRILTKYVKHELDIDEAIIECYPYDVETVQEWTAMDDESLEDAVLEEYLDDAWDDEEIESENSYVATWEFEYEN